MTARQCLALQIYVIAVARYVENPTAAFARLLAQDKRQLETAFGCKLDIPATALPASTLPDIL